MDAAEELFEMDDDPEANEDDDDGDPQDNDDNDESHGIQAIDEMDRNRIERDAQLINEIEEEVEVGDYDEDAEEDIDDEQTRLPALTINDRRDGCLMLNKVSSVFSFAS
jgi:hypothetical protein